MQIQKLNGLSEAKQNFGIQKNTAAPFNKTYPQITQLSNVYYTPQNISFGHSLQEHKSWGAQVDPTTKQVSFSLFTFPDAQNVQVRVTRKDGSQKFFQMREDETKRGRGRFITGKLPLGEVAPGDKYSYIIKTRQGEEYTVKDPYSMRQETLNGDSTIYDHSAFKWHDKIWMDGKDNRRISNIANSQNGLMNTQKLRIYELQLDTFTKEGTYKAAMKKLQDIKDMGFNSIELMPLDNTNSENWGYDGVDKLAPSDRFGSPDGLKKLIDYSHKIGLNVIIDVVPNHQGVDGNSLYSTGPYLRYKYDNNGRVILDSNNKPVVESNAFGDRYNVAADRPNYQYPRDYLANIALNWVQNYHADGIRFDMTRYIESGDGCGDNIDYTFKQIVTELRHHSPHAFIIAEDGREIPQTTTKLEDWEICADNEARHCDIIKQIENNRTDLSRIGCNSEWAFAYMHELQEMTYEAGNIYKFDDFVKNSQGKVKYVMSHDEQGNHEGTRFIAKLMVPKLKLNSLIDTNSPELNDDAHKLSQLKNKDFNSAQWNKICQKAQLNAEKLAIMLQKGELEAYKTTANMSREERLAKYQKLYNDVLKNMGLKNPLNENPNTNPSDLITYDTIKYAFETSYAQDKMSMANVFSQPGPKMIFQGDEMADLTPFRFFREFSYDPETDKANRRIEKGYDPYEISLKESKLGGIDYSSEGRKKLAHYKHLTKDLNAINDSNPALNNGYIVSTIVHDGASKLHAIHSRAKDSDNEIFAITHFSGFDYPRNGAGSYGITFPQGVWQEILNTDNIKYGGKGTHMNIYQYHGNGKKNVDISIPAYSTLIFKRVG